MCVSTRKIMTLFEARRWYNERYKMTSFTANLSVCSTKIKMIYSFETVDLDDIHGKRVMLSI